MNNIFKILIGIVAVFIIIMCLVIFTKLYNSNKNNKEQEQAVVKDTIILEEDAEYELTRQINVKSNVYFNDENDISNIIELLKNVPTDFNYSNYSYFIHPNTPSNKKIIDIVENIGDYDINSGFTIFIENGKVKSLVNSVYDKSKLNETDFMKPSNYEQLEKQYKERALKDSYVNYKLDKRSNDLLMSEEEWASNCKQDVTLQYDYQKNKKYLVIMTSVDNVNRPEINMYEMP